ncbi:MAG: nucleoside deaminase [Actinomycetota bacterium]|nr:nucleoside deaminase [Actinomycetota bacterium]
MSFPDVRLSLPGWVEELVEPGAAYPTAADRMGLAIELSRLNVRHGTGGPFGAAVFDRETGELLAPGVNLVTSANCSVAHAETVAIMVAQQAVGDFDLGGPGRPPYELVASTEPCAMCLGATPWSGVRHLLCGARGEDAEAIGFDEGTKPTDWVRSLEERGISVTRDVLRDEASAVLRDYAASGGEIYNSRRGGS